MYSSFHICCVFVIISTIIQIDAQYDCNTPADCPVDPCNSVQCVFFFKKCLYSPIPGACDQWKSVDWNYGYWSSSWGGSSWGVGNRYFYTRGLDHQLYTFDSSANYYSLGDGLTSAPAAVSWGNGRKDVFYRDMSGNLKHKWFVNNNWYGPDSWSIPNGFSGTPAVTSTGPGNLQVFVWQPSGGMASMTFSNDQWNTPQYWNNVRLICPPAVASRGPKVYLYHCGTDWNLYQATSYDNGTNWGGWNAVSYCKSDSGISATVTDDGTIHIVQKYFTSEVYYLRYKGSWIDWAYLGLRSRYDPVILNTPGTNVASVYIWGEDGVAHSISISGEFNGLPHLEDEQDIQATPKDLSSTTNTHNFPNVIIGVSISGVVCIVVIIAIIFGVRKWQKNNQVYSDLTQTLQ